jgi:hypothetical protein
MQTYYEHSYKVCVDYFVQGSKNKMVTILRIQVIFDKFTAYRMCNHSVIHPNNAGRKQQQQQTTKTTMMTTTTKYINIKNPESYSTQSNGA